MEGKQNTLYDRIQLILDSAPMSVTVYDSTFSLIDCNMEAVRMFGLSDKKHFIKEWNERFYDFFPPYQPCGAETKKKTALMFEKAVSEGRTQFFWMHFNIDGEELPADVTLAYFDYQDRPIFVAYVRDLREVKAAEERERDAKEFSNTLFERSPMFIDIWDDQFRLIDCNDQVINLFGVSCKEEYIQRADDFLPAFQPCGTPSKERSKLNLLKLLREGYAKFEWMHLDANGGELPVESTYVRLMRQGRYIFVGYNYDLRHFKMLEKQRLEIAEESNRAKTRFLARMSHEIRTPLNAVMGTTEIQLQKGGHPLDTEEAFLRVYNSSKLLLGIINDILDLSKVEVGKMEIVPTEYETVSMIADMVQLNLMYMGSKRLAFNLEVDENLPLYLVGDELRVKQILNNLLSNAFKYTQEGGVTLKFWADSGAAAGEITLFIQVSDTGQGMTKEQLDKLFDVEFTRFNMITNRGIEGSGLGMSITYSLLKMMGGSINAESKPGKGSTFTVNIPQKQEKKEVLGRETAESLRNLKSAQAYLKRVALQYREPMPYGRVLVVDDVESNLYVIKGLLLPYKLTVETAESACQAIANVKNGLSYDIIFMDHMMPDMDGVQAAKILLELGYNCPIIALTANAAVGAAQMFLNNGFSGFISKPIDPAKLDTCLMRFIRDKQPPEVIEAARHLGQDAAASGVTDRLKSAFIADAESSIAVLESLILRQEMDISAYRMYTIKTHAMKSALFNVGCAELSRDAAALEEAGRNKNNDAIQKLTPSFLDGVREIIRELSQDSEEDDSPEFDDDPEFLHNRLLAISAACQAYDVRSASDILSELGSKPVSRQTKALLNKIDDCLLLSDFEDADLAARQAADALEKQGNLPS